MGCEMNQSEPTDHSRRDFLKSGAAGIAAVAIPAATLGTQASAALRAEPVTDDQRWGLLVDATKCADGCTACVDACETENGLDLLMKPHGASDEEWERQRPRWIRNVKVKDNLSGRVTSLPMMCQQCENPPCCDVCPTGASFRRADGIVMVDRHTCIGCRYCMMACPYKARSFIHEAIQSKTTANPRGKGCVESCHLCVQRRDTGGTTTACQDACAAEGHHAILFGDLYDPNSEIAQAMLKQPHAAIRADLKLNPGVRYIGL